MKPFKFNSDFDKKLKKIKSRDQHLYSKIQKQLRILLSNPRHKSLRLHKIKSKDNLKIWSVSIDKSYRMLYEENGFISFFDIGTHDEVYKK